MRFVSKLALAAMFAAALSLMNPAMAGCRRMGFTVNDYGLEGPKRDAKNLLDKHISEWALEQGIEKYNIGKKDVSCELYLNLVVFDEHTCTAKATVCWGDSINRNKPQTASTKKPAPIKKEAAKKAKSSETEETEKDETKAADAKSSTEEEADEETQAASDDTGSDSSEDETEAAAAETDEPSEVETGAIPVPSTAAGAADAVSTLNVDTAADDTADDASSKANEATAAAAEAAAAAAERAASAAERAAKAAERAAAALAKLPADPSSTPEASASGSSSSSTGSPVAPVVPTNP